MINKKIVIICTIIALIVTVTIVAFEIKKFKEEDYAQEESYEYKQKNETQNQIINEVQEENIITTNDTETNSTNTQSENTNTQENVANQQTYQGEEETKEENENGEEKAKELAQKEWGEDDTVYFTIDNQSGNIYTVSVRSKTTTRNYCRI